jgi:SAM-dependent methyltransferase
VDGVLTVGSLSRRVAPPVLLDVAKQVRASLGAWMYPHKPVPWSRGYGSYRNRYVTTTIHDTALLDRFRRAERLPDGHGIGLDERCVEYPWCLSNLPGGAAVLDAGSVLNHRYILDHQALATATLHILTLAPEREAQWQRGISYLYGDLRDIPIRDDFYDVIVCLSTLEHVGLDNEAYTGDPPEAGDHRGDFTLAIRELRRVLRPGGTLLLSVPYGVYENRQTIQQFDRALLQQAVDAFSVPKTVSATFFRYQERGWQVATQDECDDARFGIWGTPDADKIPGALPAAEAVACVKLQG